VILEAPVWKEEKGRGRGGATVLSRCVEMGDGRRGDATQQARAEREREGGPVH
jgi:hypothetical protein